MADGIAAGSGQSISGIGLCPVLTLNRSLADQTRDSYGFGHVWVGGRRCKQPRPEYCLVAELEKLVR
jgi:hypothetical protein